MDALSLLREMIAIPGPPGQESLVAEAIGKHLTDLGYRYEADSKGNVIVRLGTSAVPRVVVTAHMDEIAMIVRRIEPDGSLAVDAMGGLFPWKLGEGPVEVLTPNGFIPGVLSFGSIHTEDPSSVVRQTEGSGLDWEMCRVVTGLDWEDSLRAGIRPGRRCVVARKERDLTLLAHGLVAGRFLDDRADLVSWLMALEALKGQQVDAWFVASASEEVGGEGALFALQQIRPEVCIALELGPAVPDAPVELTDQPTVWASDGYSTMSASDGDWVEAAGHALGLDLQFQALSRGGSDASCAAHHGLCARPITLGLPMENSHGYEIMHVGAMENLARLTVALLARL